MLNITSGRLSRPVKAVLYGVEGIGKTTFAAQFPKPLFVDLDTGSARMDVDRVSNMASWQELMDTLLEISQMDDSPYSTVVIDTVDMAAELCKKYVCQRAKKDTIEDFGFGRGYPILAQEFSKLISWATVLIDKGYNVVFIGHAMQRVVTKPDDTGSYDHWEMKLPGKGNNSLGALLKEWADLLLFADYRITIVQKDDNGRGKAAKNSGERRMRANHSPFADAKNRFGLGDDLPFEYAEIASIVPERSIRVNRPARPKTALEEAREVRNEARKQNVTPLDQVRERMQQGLPMDSAPITDEELLEAIKQTERDNVGIQAAATLENLPDGYLLSLLPDEEWQGVRMYIQNKIRVPF